MIHFDFEKNMPRHKRKKKVVEATVDYRASGFDPNSLLGSGVPKGIWHFKACCHFAYQGSAPHQNQVAEYYVDGTVVKRDLAEALRWFRLSEKQGNLYALRRIGDFYRDGLGVRTDPVKAFHYYSKAAQPPDPRKTHRALYELGRCYEIGIGCAPDMDKARTLYQQARDGGGDQKARARLKELDEIKKTKENAGRPRLVFKEEHKAILKAAFKAMFKAMLAKKHSTSNVSQQTAVKQPNVSRHVNNHPKHPQKEKIEKDWAPFVGTCGLHMKIDDFLANNETYLLKSICCAINEMFPDKKELKHTDKNRTVQSYRKTISALFKSFKELVDKSPEFGELEVALEYVIPAEYSGPDVGGIVGLRIDAIVFGQYRIAVLEFKTGSSTEEIEKQKKVAIKQVNGYLRGLDKWHEYATPRNLCACIVMFALNDTCEKAKEPPKKNHGFRVARIVSPNKLGPTLEECFDGFFDPVRNPHRWLHSFKSMGRPHDAIFNDIADYAFDHHDTMPVLDGYKKAAVRQRIADRLGLHRTAPLNPLIVALTNGRWELRDAVVQLLENLPQDRLKTLFDGWREQS